MKTAVPRLMRMLSSRVARNIYFWAWLAYSRIDYKYTPFMVLLTAILFALLAALFYGNNLVLIPRLLSRKKYLAYGLAYAGLTLAVALLYTGTLKLVMHHRPEIKSWTISPLVQSVETAELSLRSLLRETLPYFMTLAVAGGIFALSWYISHYRQLQRRIEEISEKHLQAELGFLKAQINPHFLFNTLNNLYMLTLKQSRQAPQVVEGLSTLMRYFLGESNVARIGVEKEIAMMNAYISLEMLRLNETEGLRFEIATDRPYSIPPLLWLPVLENVFKHGTRFITSRPDAEFRFTIRNAELHISSRNSYRAAAPVPGQAPGIGLSNLRRRLELLFPGQHELTSAPDGASYVTELRIQLEPKS